MVSNRHPSPEYSVFINYASKDFNAAGRPFDELKNIGLHPWLDKESILPVRRARL